MAALDGKVGGKARPNLKICIDNEEDASSSDEDMISDDGEYETSSDEVGPELNVPFSRSDISGDIEMVVRRDDSASPSGFTRSTSSPLTVTRSDGKRRDDDKHQQRLDRYEKKFKSMRDEMKDIGPKKYENKAGDFITGFDPTSKEHVVKKEKRAKRFGIKNQPTVKVTDEDVHNLYKSLGVNETTVSERGMRLEALHLRGVDDMSTTEIFTYFQEFAPGSVEWIDDSSCNVVWLDKITTARAMLALSMDPKDYSTLLASQSSETSASTGASEQTTKEGPEKMDTSTEKAADKQQSEEEYDDDLDLMSDDDTEKVKPSEDTKTATSEKPVSSKEKDETSSSKEAVTEKAKSQKSFRPQPVEPPLKELAHLPPGKWRIGKPGPNTDELYFRFATKADKKMPGAEKHSKYYVKHGNPNYGGMTGLLSEGKKKKVPTATLR